MAHPDQHVDPQQSGIDPRPVIVKACQRVGDWEDDTIIGAHDGGAAIASMVKRQSVAQ